MDTKILHKEISFVLQGCVFAIRNEYGSGHKESVYQNLLVDFLRAKNILVEKEKRIPVHSSQTGKVVGSYRPDLLVADKIVVEIKAQAWTIEENKNQLIHYLKNSIFEIGYLINFGSSRLYMKRFIFTNNRKPFVVIRNHSC